MLWQENCTVCLYQSFLSLNPHSSSKKGRWICTTALRAMHTNNCEDGLFSALKLLCILWPWRLPEKPKGYQSKNWPKNFQETYMQISPTPPSYHWKEKVQILCFICVVKIFRLPVCAKKEHSTRRWLEEKEHYVAGRALMVSRLTLFDWAKKHTLGPSVPLRSSSMYLPWLIHLL